jgi:casein kinase II subunit beta
MKIYEPRIFGFRVNERSRSGPKMQWLRMRYTEDDDDNEASADDADEVHATNNIEERRGEQ